jgi:hypothetical protein
MRHATAVMILVLAFPAIAAAQVTHPLALTSRDTIVARSAPSDTAQTSTIQVEERRRPRHWLAAGAFSGAAVGVLVGSYAVEHDPDSFFPQLAIAAGAVLGALAGMVVGALAYTATHQ